MVLGIVITCLGVMMSVRILFGLILSNIHQIKNMNKYENKHSRKPKISIIIPAYNEEVCVYRCVISVLNSPYKNKQVIVVDDGSTDKTPEILESIRKRYQDKINEGTFVLYRQENQGKAHAINNGIKRYADGELIMVLDSDSYIKEDALKRVALHFQNPKLIALSSNVRIIKPKSFIEFVQKIEYMLGYRLKGSEQLLGIEYIIGGIGSTFRRDAMETVNYYDYDSITEDIDFTIKLIKRFGNKRFLFGYADDVLVYTPAVKNFPQLIKQRYRWKYGRFKALFKYKSLFFSKRLKYTKTLTWFKLPKVFLEEFIMFIDPIAQLYILYIVWKYADFSTFLGILFLYTVFGISSFLGEKTETWSEKLLLLVLSPISYVMLSLINVVDYVSLIKCLFKSKEIIYNSNTESKWTHVDR